MRLGRVKEWLRTLGLKLRVGLFGNLWWGVESLESWRELNVMEVHRTFRYNIIVRSACHAGYFLCPQRLKCTQCRTPNRQCRHHFVLYVGLIPPAPKALLFLLFSFGAPPPGVLGLFSLLLPFLAGGTSVFNGVGAASFPTDNGPLFAVAGTSSLSFLPVLRWKSPG